MNRIPILGLALLVLIGHLVSASYCRAVDDNENSAPAQWWMYSGQTGTDVGNTISSQNARIVDIKVDNFSPYPFSVTYVQNTGSYAKQWWWYTGIDGPTLSANLSKNNARLTAFKAYDVGGGQIRFTVAMISNTGADAKTSWFYSGLSTTDIGNWTKTNNARLTSLQSYVSNGKTLYAVIMIANTGTDAKAWWWYTDSSTQTIGSALATNKARLLDLTSAGNGNFNAVMESCTSGCPAWWWYTDQAGSQVLSTAQQNGARVLTADTYPGCGGYCFAAVMIGGSTGTQHGNVPARLRGFVDLHTHPLSNLGFGGKIVYGGVDVGALLPADPLCNQHVLATSMLQALASDGSTHASFGVNLNPFNGQGPITNSCGDAIRAQVIHHVQQGNYLAADEPDDSSGAPGFPSWPVWNDITHQKMWVDWIKRSYDGGLRVMVALAVNSKLLGDLAAGPGDFATDDLASGDQQIDATIAFVNRHSDFMEVAYRSSDVARIVNANKLAVVLGVELDDIGDLNELGRPPQDNEISAAVAHLYDKGVRYVFPIHLTDNQFGGTAAYIDDLNQQTRYEAGHWWNLVCATDPNITYVYGSCSSNCGFSLSNLFNQVEVGAAALAKLGSAAANLLSSPSYPQCAGQVNQLGLQQQGATAIQEMMKRGMLIDVDHMSQNSANCALTMASLDNSANCGFPLPQNLPGHYPMMSGHNAVRGSKGNERSLTSQQYGIIGGLHGMAGVGSARVDAWTWIKNYLAVVQAMGGTAAAGFGTDTDGLELGMPPRPLSTVQYTNSFPMSSLGTQSWNYNNPVFGGVAHYGMLPDFLADARTAPNGADLIDNNLMYGAQYFYETWQMAEAQSTQLSASGCPSNGNCCGRTDQGGCEGKCVAENASCSHATGYQCGSNQKCCGTADSHGNCSGTCVASSGSCTQPGPTATEDDGTQMTFNGTAVHVCPTGMVMTGVDANNNRFLCATGYALPNPENPTVDTSTQGSFTYNGGPQSVHVCPPGMVMVGWNKGNNWLVCVLDEAFGYTLGAGIGTLHVDGPGGTQVPEPNNSSTNMHSCDPAGSGGSPYAMAGIDVNNNVLICQNGAATPGAQ